MELPEVVGELHRHDAPAGPPRQTRGMGQEHDDYADPEPRPRRRWAPLRIAVLALAMVASIPVVAVLAFFAMWFANS